MTMPAFVLGLLLAATALATPAAAQSTGVPNALQGFSQNRDQPVKIEAATLEVRDKDKVATFSGDVKVVQGDTTMRCKSLLVFYDNENKPGAMKTDKPGPGGQQAIKRLEARGGVIVTQKDQTATGAIGIFDMAKNTITLDGNVMITQGQNVLRGERLVVDVATGAARVESGSKGRVSGVLFPGSASPDKTGSADKKPGDKGAKEAERPAGRDAGRSLFPVAPRGIY
ncbi:MAG: LPS ABC transporter substrate-binding protein LptA [Pseudorhodoplanes sp.]|nr:LPS ABC transporter substrate-binding protein LptA [Pseudorhodoplanes sp.]